MAKVHLAAGVFVGVVALAAAVCLVLWRSDADFWSSAGAEMSSSQSSEGRVQTSYSCRYKATGWSFSVYVNGIPVRHSQEGTNLAGEVPVTRFVKHGSNTLKVEARQTADLGQGTHLLVSIVATPISKPTEVQDKPVTLEWTNMGVGKTATVSRDFKGANDVRWAWEKAAPIQNLTDTDKRRLLGLIEAFYEALKEGDAGGVSRIRHLANQEEAKEHNLGVEEVERQASATLKKMFKDHSVKTKRLPPEQIGFSIHGPVVLARAIADQKQVASPSPIVEIDLAPAQSYSWDTLLFLKLRGEWYLLK